MIAKEHKTIKYMYRALACQPAFTWLQEAPEMTQIMLQAPAVVAQWIVNTRPDWLSRPNIKVTVTAELDTIDDGAWWGLLGPLLDKPSDWAVVEVVTTPGTKIQKTPIVPRGFGKSCRVLQKDMDQFIAEKASGDLLVFNGYDGVFLDAFLDPEEKLEQDQGILSFVRRGGIVLSCNDRKVESLLNAGYAEALGLKTSEFEQSLYKTSLSDGYKTFFAVEKGNDLTIATSDSWVIRMDAVAEAALDVFSERDTNSSAEDDIKQWGSEGLLKSSVDNTDTYIILPQSYAVRRRTGKVCLVEDDLVIGDALPVTISTSSLYEYDTSGPWFCRAALAAHAWNGGVGKYLKNTVGGILTQGGADISIGQRRQFMEEIVDSIGLAPDQKELFLKSTVGDKPHTPSLAERKLFDLLKAGQCAEIVLAVKAQPELVHALNETNCPLIHEVAEKGHIQTMKELCQLGADINSRDGYGRPLILNVVGAPPGVLDTAIKLGADVDGTDYTGCSALFVALKQGKWHSVERLINAGADPTIEAPGGSVLEFIQGKEDPIGLQAHHRALSESSGIDFEKMLKTNGFVFSPSQVPSHIRKSILAFQPK